MAPYLIYLACVVGALGLYLLVRPNPAHPLKASSMTAAGGLMGVLAFGWLIVSVGPAVTGGETGDPPSLFFLLFCVIALASATMMITSPRPVYSALYFVLVVIATAGLFLLLEAEFMAFALIIVYAGAILITYMFVLMLAQQSPDPDDPGGVAEYDLRAREPLSGAIVGFILLALLTRTVFDAGGTLEPRVTAAQGSTEAWMELREMPKRIDEVVARAFDDPHTVALAEDGKPLLEVSADGQIATVRLSAVDGGEEMAFDLPADARPENVQSVGLGLIQRFPVSLEVAGVILLMAMFGAVILARRQMELTDDEKREAAGLARLGHHDETAAEGGGA